MLTWYNLETGGLSVTRRKELLDKARAEFEAARAAFPNNRIARMYLGEPMAWQRPAVATEGAPAWAVWQCDALERLVQIIDWWIDHRMRPDGQYGGGWGDDCEMWRWWVPALVAFDDPKIVAAQKRFSAALLAQKHLRTGYMQSMTDVEHSAEDTADAITPMMHLSADDPAWADRARRLTTFMETLWTGRNQRGQLQFRSTYFTCDRVDNQPQRACDTVYHPRAVQPALLLWQRTGDKGLGKLFAAWMDTWVDATARAERGKPAGIIPSAIHWPEGSIGGTSPDWWDPRNHGEATLYLWPSAMRMMLDTLLLTWYQTGNDKYLEPIRSMAVARREFLQGKLPDEAPGSRGWCARQLSIVAPTLAKYRRLSGDRAFDDILAKDYAGLANIATGSDRRELVAALQNTAEALHWNLPGYTSEVRYTDRVLRFPQLFGKAGLADVPAVAIRPNTDLLYSTLTGDPGECGYFPLAAVRWLTPARQIAALVVDSNPANLRAELFHFGAAPRPMAAELLLLKPGHYRFQLNDARGTTLATQTIEVTGPRSRIDFTLPPRQLCALSIAPL